MAGKSGCKRCVAINKNGERCKNRVSCIKRCTKYCHVHSNGYQKPTNKICKRSTFLGY